MMPKTPPGFTYAELIIVLAITGLLFALAVPAYREYLQRSARVQAVTTLLRAANWLEQQHTVNHAYATPANPARLPPELRQSPQSGAARYRLEVIGSASGYTLSAIPLDDDECGTYTLDQSGRRAVTGNLAECWR